MTTNTENARRVIGPELDACRIAQTMRDAERERKFCIAVCRHLEDLKHSQNAIESALATRLSKMLFDREYDRAIEAWRKR